MDGYEIVPIVVLLIGLILGFRRGALRIALPLVVVATGVFLIDRYESRLLDILGDGIWTPVVLVAALLVAAAIGAAVGEAVGGGEPLGVPDQLLGGVLGAGLGAVALWLGGALVDASGPEGREAVARSEVLSGLLTAMPPERVLETLARFDDIPVISTFVPTRQPPATPDAVGPAGVLDRVRAGVVRIDTDACDGRWLGTGWVASRGLVVTNAHVVAGEDRPRVTDAAGDSRDGRVVFADIRNDLALVEVSGLTVPALPIGTDPAFGVPLTFTGHPDGGPLVHRPAASGGVESTFTTDAVGGRVWRRFLVLRGEVRPGNSGGPVTDAGGRVVGTIAAGDGDQLGFAVPVAQIRAALSAPRSSPVVPCEATPG